MPVELQNWDEVIRWVLLTGRSFTCPGLTIDRQGHPRSIAITTPASEQPRRFQPADAVKHLESNHQFPA